MAIIQIVSGVNSGEEHELAGRETLIGRHPECQIVLRDSTVSRRHARISQDQHGFWVHDLGSQHGTRVNGELIRGPHYLSDQDEILLSQVTLVFRLYSVSDEEDLSRQTTRDRPSTIVTSINVLSDETSSEDSKASPKWKALLDITRSLGVSLDLKEVLPGVLDNVFKILPQATRGCILITDRNSSRLRPFAVKHASGKTEELPVLSRTISNSVMTEGKAVLISDTEDSGEAASESMVDLKMRSIMCAPLIGSSEKPFGLLHLDTQNPGKPFTADDLDILVNISNLVGQAIGHAHLHETALQFDRRERDLETARQVQQHFLPRERPDVTGYELFDYYKPAEAVGGDYFGYTALPDGQLAIAVGDVAGHGVPAALLMARLCSEARYSLVTQLLPSDAVQSLNHELSKRGFSYFITFSLCVLDPVRHELTIVNAGHMAPLVRRARTGIVEALGLDATGPPLGIDPTLEFQQAKANLEPGDVVMMYTDGVSEAPNLSGGRYGIDRIKHVLASAKDARDLMERILSDVRAFSFTRAEDITGAFVVEQLIGGSRAFTQPAPQEDDVCIVAFARRQDE